MQARRLEVQASSDRADDAMTSGQIYEVVWGTRHHMSRWIMTLAFATILNSHASFEVLV